MARRRSFFRRRRTRTVYRSLRRQRRGATRIVYRGPRTKTDRIVGFFKGMVRKPISRGLATGLGVAALSSPLVLNAGGYAPDPSHPTVLEAVQSALTSPAAGGGAITNPDGSINWPASGLGAARLGIQTYIGAVENNVGTIAGLAIGAVIARKGGQLLGA